ncbi:unnamed protein product, partial [Pylaiella littoralis]
MEEKRQQQKRQQQPKKQREQHSSSSSDGKHTSYTRNQWTVLGAWCAFAVYAATAVREHMHAVSCRLMHLSEHAACMTRPGKKKHGTSMQAAVIEKAKKRKNRQDIGLP